MGTRSQSLELQGGIDEGHQTRHDLLRGDTLRLGAEVEENPMSQDRRRQCPHIVARDGVSPLQRSSSLPTENQCLAGPRPCSPGQHFVDEVGGSLARSGSADQVNREGRDVITDRNCEGLFLKSNELPLRESCIQCWRASRCRPGDDLRLLFGAGVTDTDPEEEPIELGLRQGICPLLLDGVLGGTDEEGLRGRLVLDVVLDWVLRTRSVARDERMRCDEYTICLLYTSDAAGEG